MEIASVAILNNPSSLEDFKKLDWRKAIAKSAKHECGSYYHPLCELVNEAQQQSPGALAAARMLLFVCGLHLHADNVHQPLQPATEFSQLDATDIAFLREIAPSIDNPEIRSRVEDLLWIHAKDFNAARSAIESYILTAKALFSSNDFHASERLERAVRLALSLNQKDKVREIGQLAYDKFSQEPPTLDFVVVRYTEILLHTSWDEPIAIAQRAEKLADRAMNGRNFLLHQRLLELSAEWFSLAANTQERFRVLTRRAESYVKEAEELAKKPNMSFGQPMHLVECAVQALRYLPEKNDRIEALLRLRDEYNAKFIAQMVPLSEPLNVEDIAAQVRSHVTKNNTHDAIMALAFIVVPPSLKKMREEVSKSNEQFLSRQIFGTTVLGATGRTAARSAPIRKPDDGTSEAFRNEMLRTAAHHRSFTVQALIEPGRLHILDQHRIRADDLASFIWNNPLVPLGRERLFLEGLLAGFRGDFMASTHILVPQLEHLIRLFLYVRGLRTSTYSSTGLEKESNLNSTLFEPELLKALGEDLVFDLQGLLVEPFGSNLRNEMAHGMRDYFNFFAPDTIYSWWLILHLLCKPMFTSFSNGVTENTS